MTGKYLVPFCKKRFLLTLFSFFHLCSHSPLSSANADTFPVCGDGFFVIHLSILGFCSHYFRSFVSAHTRPFRQPVGWHFSQGKASHSLLQRRFAPQKAVRLLPAIRGRLEICILSLFPRHAETAFFIWSVSLFFCFSSYKKPDFFFPGKLKWPAFASHFIKDIHIDITTPGRWVKGFVLSCCARHFCFCCVFCYFIFRMRCSLDEIGKFFSFFSHVGEYFCRIDTMLHDSSE